MSALTATLESRAARVAVVGQGYVGLVVAMRATEAGFEVVGLEADADRVASLRDGVSYVEDVPDAVLRAALEAGYRPTADPADLAGFDVGVISVPSPLREGVPDLSFIEDGARALGDCLQAGALAVLESTTYPGTTTELVGPILAEASGLAPGEDFLLGYSPERIDPGNPEFGLANTPKVVAGIDAASLQAVEAFYGAFVDETVPVSGCAEAETTKLLENTFRHVNIALVNELARFAEGLGVDVYEAIDAAATKPFGFMKFTPGPGVGGHCLPIDPTFLSWRVKRRVGQNFRFVELANEVNDAMPGHVVDRVTGALNRDRKAVNGSRILIVGLSYKPNVGDAREAPSLPIVDELVALGAEVVGVDPYVGRLPLDETVAVERTLDRELLEGCDLAVIVTDHDCFDYELIAKAAPRVLDTRNRLRHAGVVTVEQL